MNDRDNISPATRRCLHIAFCANDGYVPYLCVTLKSIAETHRGDFDISIHILTDDITPASAERIAGALEGHPGISHKIYWVDDSKLEGQKVRHYTKYTWYRMLLPDLLPDIDKIFYLDTDVAVADSLREILDYDITPYAIATAPDADTFTDTPFERCGYPKELGYVCVGVMLMNLDYWRRHNIAEQVLAWGREHYDVVRYPDQDSINYVCRHAKGTLPLRFGVTRSTFTSKWFYTPEMKAQLRDCLERPAVVHYAGCAPWIRESDHPLNDIWLRYNAMLPHPAPRRYSAKGMLKYKLMAWDALHPSGRYAMTRDQIRAKIDAIAIDNEQQNDGNERHDVGMHHGASDDNAAANGCTMVHPYKLAKKCRLLVFIESLQCGGAEKSLVSLLQMLNPAEYDIDLMLLRRDGIFMKYVPEWIHVIDFPGIKPGIRSKAAQAAFALKWRALQRLGVKRHNAETRWPLLGPSMRPLPGRYDMAIAYQQGLPTYYIATKVDAAVKCAWVNIDLEGAGYRPEFNRPFYDRYDHIVAVSQQLYDRLIDSEYIKEGRLPAYDDSGLSQAGSLPSLKANRLTTIYDILNVDLIRCMATEPVDDAGSRAALNLVTVGRLSRQKNYPLAVETARVLRDSGVDFRWVFVGEGAERPAIEALIERYGLADRVILAGLQENPYKFMQQADIYVHTASFEGYGLTIAEAKILGKPVVSTNFNIVYDQIDDGRNGLIAEMTPESVAACISRLHTDRALLQSITAAIASESNTTATTEVEKFHRLRKIWQN